MFSAGNIGEVLSSAIRDVGDFFECTWHGNLDREDLAERTDSQPASQLMQPVDYFNGAVSLINTARFLSALPASVSATVASLFTVEDVETITADIARLGRRTIMPISVAVNILHLVRDFPELGYSEVDVVFQALLEQNPQAAFSYNEIAQLAEGTWLGGEIKSADFLSKIRTYGPRLGIGQTARTVEVLVRMLRGDFGPPGSGEFINQMSQGEREILSQYRSLEGTERTAIDEVAIRVFEIISRRTSGVEPSPAVPEAPPLTPETPPTTPEASPVTPETPVVSRMPGAALREGPVVESSPVRGTGPRGGGFGGGGLLGGGVFVIAIILPILELPIQAGFRDTIRRLHQEGVTHFEVGGQQYIIHDGMI